MLVFIVSLIILRKEASDTVVRYRLETGFEPVEVGEFDHLEFGPGWEVTVTRGLSTAVSMLVDKYATPTIESKGDTLVFGISSDSLTVNHSNKVRITVEYLRSIKAAKDTSIELVDLDLDSLSVMLENTESFSGINTNIKHLFLYTSGEVALELSQKD